VAERDNPFRWLQREAGRSVSVGSSILPRRF